jgi:F0F1-type ATP synthase epsilon subunit
MPNHIPFLKRMKMGKIKLKETDDGGVGRK